MDDDNRRAEGRVAQPVSLPGGAVIWQKVSDYCITSGDLNICDIYVAGVVRYELWDLREKPARFVSAHGSAQGAKDAARDAYAAKPEASP